MLSVVDSKNDITADRCQQTLRLLAHVGWLIEIVYIITTRRPNKLVKSAPLV